MQTIVRELFSKVTTKGQVTIPVEIRRRLGVSSQDKISFIIKDDNVHLKRAGSVVAQTAGILKSDISTLSPRDEKIAAEKAIAKDVEKRVKN